MRRALLSLFLFGLVGCSGELSDSDNLFRVADASGSIRVPLVGEDAAGHKYHLRGATFEVSGTAMVTLNDSASSDALATPLPTGGYQMYLRPGFQVVEVGEDGSERAIPAVLSSANPALFSVAPRATGRLHLAFRHGDVEIAFGGADTSRRARAPVRTATPSALAVAR
jgi:hypothetical protein